MLDYAAAYFQLGPIERRIYEVARATAEGGRLEVDLATFRLQIGYQNPLANFRSAMKAIALADTIPDFHVALVEQGAEDEAEAEGAAPPEQPRGRGRRSTPVRVVITARPPLLESEAHSEGDARESDGDDTAAER